MWHYLSQRPWTRLVFFCFGIMLFLLLPSSSTAIHQYDCTGATDTYADAKCLEYLESSISPTTWQSCADSDQTGQCIQVQGAGLANLYQKTRLCTQSETCGHPTTVTLSAEPLDISPGDSSVLSWTSVNTTGCVASGAWSGPKATTSKQVVSPSQTSTYTLTCSGSFGDGSDSITITVTAPALPTPIVDISANPDSVVLGKSSLLSWTASDGASSCIASGAWGGFKALSGSESVTPSITSTYTLACTGQGGSANDSVIIAVTASQTSNTDTTSQNISAGGTVTTDTEGDNTTVSDPIEASVTSPVGGQIIINKRLTTGSAPSGFSFLPREIRITAPPAPPANPLILSFQLNLSLVPAATNPNTIRVFKDRVLVAGCPGNPCISKVAVSGNNIEITVRTSSASAWNFGFPQAAALISSGGLVSCGGAGQNPCQFCDIFKLVKNILDIFLFPFVPIIGALLFAIGGFFMFAGGANPQMLSRGKTILIATVVGLLIIYLSWIFISFILTFFGVVVWTGPGTWWEISC